MRTLAVIILTVVVLIAAPVAEAAEITVLCSNGVKAVVEELAPLFGRITGDKVTVQYDSTVTIINQIKGGAKPDLVILTAEAIDDLVIQGRVAGGSRVDIAQSGMGIAMRAGGRKPDISTVDAFKKTLLSAKSLALTKNGVSGIYFLQEVFKKLGIESQMKPKTILVETGPVGTLIANGKAEFGVQQVSEILPVTGIELAGPLPTGLQRMTVFSAGISAGSKQADAARALVKFLTADANKALIRKKGLEPR